MAKKLRALEGGSLKKKHSLGTGLYMCKKPRALNDNELLKEQLKKTKDTLLNNFEIIEIVYLKQVLRKMNQPLSI
jgi:hypothetical protein